MISKNKSRFIVSLHNKKAREEEKLYIIEGEKIVREYLIAGAQIRYLCATAEFLGGLNKNLLKNTNEVFEVSEAELKKMSSLKVPNSAIAVAGIEEKKLNHQLVFGELNAALDAIRDPGNLGTIIRAAAWFGIRNIICSEDCADVFNPKTVQATMGAILHVNIFYMPLKEYLKLAKANGIPVFGAVMDGESVYNNSLSEKGIILIGNESKGISAELITDITHRITIPRSGISAPGSESLNAGMAASIIFSEFARRKMLKIHSGN
jgi:RNA methyltransferase, TrmH family